MTNRRWRRADRRPKATGDEKPAGPLGELAAEFANGVRADVLDPLAKLRAGRQILVGVIKQAQAERDAADLRVGELMVMLGIFEVNAKMIEAAIQGGLADFEAALQVHNLLMSTTLGTIQ